MANTLKHKQATAAQQVVSRLDSYTQDEHIEFIEAARQRTENRRVARRERARAAALRLRDAI